MFGEVGNLRDALVQIIIRLREDALRDRDSSRSNPTPVDSMYSSSLPVQAILPSVTPVAPIGYDQRAEAERGGIGMFTGGSNLYGYNSLQVH